MHSFWGHTFAIKIIIRSQTQTAKCGLRWEDLYGQASSVVIQGQLGFSPHFTHITTQIRMHRTFGTHKRPAPFLFLDRARKFKANERLEISLKITSNCTTGHFSMGYTCAVAKGHVHPHV